MFVCNAYMPARIVRKYMRVFVFLAHIYVEQTHEKRIDTYLVTKTHRAETIARKLGKKPHIHCVVILKQMAHHWKATGDCYERQSSLREQAKFSRRTFRSLMPIENSVSHSINIRYLWQVQFMSLMQFLSAEVTSHQGSGREQLKFCCGIKWMTMNFPHFIYFANVKFRNIVELNTCRLFYDQIVDKKSSNFVWAAYEVRPYSI